MLEIGERFLIPVNWTSKGRDHRGVHILLPTGETKCKLRKKMNPAMWQESDTPPKGGHFCSVCSPDRFFVDPDEQRMVDERVARLQEEARLLREVIATREDFVRLPVETQMRVSMLRTIAWIRGYKAFWIVATAKTAFGVRLDIELVHKLPNEMPDQDFLDYVNQLRESYFKSKVRDD